jgi:hypothetical protein
MNWWRVLIGTDACIRTGTGTVKVTDDVGHAGFVAHNCRQMDGLLGVILRN